MSESEYRVFTQFKSGLGDAEIAERLGLRDKTVKFHMQGIYRKFGITGPHHKSRRLFAMILESGVN